MHTHGNFRVLPHWEIRWPAYTTQSLLPLSHYTDTDPISLCPVRIMPRTWLGSNKWRSLFQNALSAIPNVNAKFKNRVLGKSLSYICKYISIYAYMKSSFLKPDLQTWDWHLKNSFPKHVKSHSRKWACNTNVKLKFCVSGKDHFTYVYMHIYICTYLWKFLFQNVISQLGIAIATSIFGFALNAFWKRVLQILFLKALDLL